MGITCCWWAVWWKKNGAHSRLGYGAGHFFRAMEGLDAGGIDVVDNLMPEQTSGCYSTAFNEFDCDFSHWGLAEMAASAAHADPKKHGRVLCEAFGAYGWHRGSAADEVDHRPSGGAGGLMSSPPTPSPPPPSRIPTARPISTPGAKTPSSGCSTSGQITPTGCWSP